LGDVGGAKVYLFIGVLLNKIESMSECEAVAKQWHPVDFLKSEGGRCFTSFCKPLFQLAPYELNSLCIKIVCCRHRSILGLSAAADKAGGNRPPPMLTLKIADFVIGTE
jgi:hypothetical protein